jgi:hypothetical protein
LEFSHSFAFQDNSGLHISHFFSLLFFFAVVVLKVLYFQQVAHHVMALPPYSKVQTSGGQVPGLESEVRIRGFGFGS